ncbi:pectate lyase [Alteromonas sp. D210916BOD_24]|uniref:pectate lyase family protein n=1 Tax=Alteromonas sp. D210916BOD_24 TaxID=3157618 RepID=UPI00399C87EB
MHIRNLVLALFFISNLLPVVGLHAETLAFPGALGFGKYTQGGNKGKVLIVDSLEDTSKRHKGTLRWAVNQPYPRLVVFNVSGVIKLTRPLDISHDNITIAGQTSPKGIVISGAQTRVSANQVILRFLRFRPGNTEGESDALFIRNQRDIIVDHCSFSWANDEVGSFYSNTRFTLQNSILSESLNKAGHSKGSHGYGGIWGGSFASFVQNVLVSHTSRNPRINGWRLNPPYVQSNEFVDIRNNVIANWGKNSSYGGEGGRANFVDNYFKPGPATEKRRFFQLWPLDNTPTLLHVSGNVMHGDDAMTDNNLLGIDVKNMKRDNPSFEVILSKSIPPQPYQQEALAALGDPILSAKDAWEKLVINGEVGATRARLLAALDPVDQRVISHVRTGNYVEDGIIDAVEEVTQWSDYARYFQTTQQFSYPETDDIWRIWSDL